MEPEAAAIIQGTLNVLANVLALPYVTDMQTLLLSIALSESITGEKRPLALVFQRLGLLFVSIDWTAPVDKTKIAEARKLVAEAREFFEPSI